MATYKSEAGAILQPGNQINRLSSYNTEGVHGWPGLDFFELVGFIKVSNKTGTKANFKSFDITAYGRIRKRKLKLAYGSSQRR